MADLPAAGAPDEAHDRPAARAPDEADGRPAVRAADGAGGRLEVGALDGGAGAPAGVLAALVASVADGVYVVDHAGDVRFVNPAGAALLGYDDPAALLGRPSHATIHDHRPDGTPFPEDECPLLRPRATGEPVQVAEDWFVRADGTMLPVSYSSAPFPTAVGRGAVVVFRDETARRASEEARRAAEDARRHAAVERARADEVAASRRRIVAAADAERRRIGRDLHDGAQQRLMTVALTVQQAQRALDADPDGARAALDAAVAEARTSVAELRELVAGIHPSILSHRGLAAAVESLTARAPLPVARDVPERRWPADVEAGAYFVVAEALANVVRHANAHHAAVTVTEAAGTLRLAVRDDGRGGASARVGGGLEGLGDRVAALGGTLRVEDAPEGGTLVVASLPVAG